MAPKYCRFRSVGTPVPEHSKARERADKCNLALGKVMSRTLEMLVYGVIASLQIVVAVFVLAHYPHSATPRPQAQPPARAPAAHATLGFSVPFAPPVAGGRSASRTTLASEQRPTLAGMLLIG
jgi:hypothetical protein